MFVFMSTVVALQQFRAKSRAPCVDSLSQFSMESTTSADSREPQFVAAGDIRKRLTDSIAMPKKKFNVCIVLSPYLLLISLMRIFFYVILITPVCSFEILRAALC